MTTTSTVFLLGAGFGKAMGLPVLRDFLECARDIFDQPTFSSHPLYGSFDKVFQFRKNIAAVTEKFNFDLDNIETLLGYLDMYEMTKTSTATKKGETARLDDAARLITHTLLASKKLERRLKVTVAPEAKLRLNTFLTTSAEPNSFKINPAELLCGLALGKFSENPTKAAIVSFNYDDLIEEGLKFWSAKALYDVPAARDERTNTTAKEELPIFKLHGSVTWRKNPQARGRGSICYTDNPANFEDQREVVLTPPTWNKGGLSGALKGVWESAISHLMNCKHLVAIGYSLPPSDEYIKYALGTALGNNYRLKSITVVDPSPDTQKRFEEILTPNTVKRRLNARPTGLEEFFGDPQHYAHLGLSEQLMRVERY